MNETWFHFNLFSILMICKWVEWIIILKLFIFIFHSNSMEFDWKMTRIDWKVVISFGIFAGRRVDGKRAPNSSFSFVRLRAVSGYLIKWNRWRAVVDNSQHFPFFWFVISSVFCPPRPTIIISVLFFSLRPKYVTRG